MRFSHFIYVQEGKIPKNWRANCTRHLLRDNHLCSIPCTRHLVPQLNIEIDADPVESNEGSSLLKSMIISPPPIPTCQASKGRPERSTCEVVPQSTCEEVKRNIEVTIFHQNFQAHTCGHRVRYACTHTCTQMCRQKKKNRRSTSTNAVARRCMHTHVHKSTEANKNKYTQKEGSGERRQNSGAVMQVDAPWGILY